MHVVVDWVRDLAARGGPVLFLLLGVSLLLGTVIVERLLAFHKSKVDQVWLLQQMGLRLSNGHIDDAREFVSRVEGCLARVFEVGLKRVQEERGAIQNAMRTAVAREALFLQRNVAVIGTSAVIAPFIGLFGTVLGIMHAFESIAARGGTGPTVVAGGVAEALLNTAVGLFVAIIAVVAFNYFTNRIRSTLDQMEIQAETFGDMLEYTKAGKPFPADLRDLVNLR